MNNKHDEDLWSEYDEPEEDDEEWTKTDAVVDWIKHHKILTACIVLFSIWFLIFILSWAITEEISAWRM